eukprot:9891114-Alexandrium_andersonii.AAC.1
MAVASVCCQMSRLSALTASPSAQRMPSPAARNSQRRLSGLRGSSRNSPFKARNLALMPSSYAS